MVKKIEISQHAKYTCSFCGKVLSNAFHLKKVVWELKGENYLAAPAEAKPALWGMFYQDEETSCGNLALWFLHENGSWWCVDLQFWNQICFSFQHHFCRHSKVCHQKTEGIEGPVEAPPFDTLLAYNKRVNLCNKITLVCC
nr:large ribosomal subunit protein eL43 isoform X2 [Kogia breviceps]XP_058908788.1 large ribosomal subunit protein eL43 isoform X2 [Kogia breviceps]